MSADAWLAADVWDDVLTAEEAIAAAALHARFRRFSCPSWRRIGRRVVEVVCEARERTVNALAISLLPPDLKEAAVEALVRMLRAELSLPRRS